MQPRPEPLPRPLPLQRPSERKRMTIALGILASGGIAFAADTQETEGYFKGFALKIHSASAEDFGPAQVASAIAVTGAGSAVYLDVISDEIIRDFRRYQDSTILAFEQRLRNRVEEFHSKHVTPLPAHLARDISLIVGVQIEGQSGLWRTDVSAVKQSRGFEAVGTGHPYARMAIEKHALTLNSETAAVLAVLGVEVAKRYDQDCGHETTVTFLKNNRAYHVPWYMVKEAEHLFEQYAGTEYSAFHYAIGTESYDEAQRPRKLMRSLRNLRREFTKLGEKFLKHAA